METEIVKELNKSLSQPSTSQESCQIKKCIKPKLVIKEKIAIPEPEIDVFTRFINICLEKRNDDITIKILDKLRKRYEKLEPICLNNEELKSFIEDIIQNILKTDEKKFYFYIEEVSNEIKRLNCESKIVQIDEKYANTENNKLDKVEINENIVLEQENHTLSENYIPLENHALSKNDLHKLKKLNKAIRKCQQRIKILETQEVDFDDEEDSTYIQEDRYKRKLIELCALRSKLIGDKSVKKQIYKQLLRLKDIPGKITGIRVLDEAILTFINSSIKKVNRLKHIKNPTAIADFLTVPDYHDIIQCISDCNNQEDLELTDRKIKMLALTAHQSLVHYLKKQRICESQNYLSFYGESKGDPAITNDELHTKLQQNKEKGDRKLENIFKQYEKKEELTASEEDQQTLGNTCSEDEDKNENEKTESNVNLTEKNVEKIFKSSEEKEENLESSNFEDKSQQNDRKTNDKQTDKTKRIITFAQIEISPRKLVEKNLENSFKNSEEIEQLSPVDRIHETLKNIDFDRIHQQNEKCTNDDEKEETKETNLPAENEKLAEKEDRVEGRLEKILKNSEDNERLLLGDENQQTLENANLNKHIKVHNNICFSESKAPEENVDVNKKKKWIGQEFRYAIKVRSFAKPPDSWKDSSSPEKVEQNLSLPKQQRIADLPTPGFIDLTSEQNYRLPSTSAIVSNPLAINNRRMPVNNAVLLKNIISNYKIPFHQNDVKGPKIATLKNVCVVNPKIGQAMTYVPKTNILLSNVNPDNNLNHVPNTLSSNTVISPCLTVRLQENNT
ncbi:PREDICTED: death domain-associated protein 6-like [Ceratosolen solmsi marchali]|uniref:Death domain-associated protein 6-like n=1 Tax=Ceratosolen solmsi marchali TaxID=326594 RepID=A0AAJ6YLV8_9HYME|nr:PREDICTED: death domain-associated protein 6-like [Ceratosolen solmsi marchali]